MSRYALWNNKGGVGKSFLTFSLACEYAIANPDEDVLVLDLCPQANLTEMFLGGKSSTASALDGFYGERPRRSVGGYFEARLTSPFMQLPSIADFICKPSDVNENIPSNISLLAGDNLLELLAEAIRGVAQLPLPVDAWAKVMRWLVDLTRTFTDASLAADVATFVDCNPSFSIYTQIALCSAENLIIPFTADDSSRRGIENVFALLYGVASSELQGYARLSFSNRANEEKIDLPRIHTFVSNRATYYRGKPSSAFEAKSAPIKQLVETAASAGKRYFVSHKRLPDLFSEIPDYHSVAIVASSEGCPLSLLRSGHHEIDGDTVQVNQISIDRYTRAIAKLVQRL
jgi:cellulose biosynthesis protein BcsQ